MAVGAVVALRERASALLSGSWLFAVRRYVLTASLGCVRLRIAGEAAVAWKPGGNAEFRNHNGGGNSCLAAS